MNRSDLPTLLSDLDDLSLRCKDAGCNPAILEFLTRARDMMWLASQVPEADPHRDSYPPTLEANMPTRTAATEAFRNVRRMLRDFK